MNYQEVLDYVEELKKYGSVPGLSSVQRLCERLKNPQDKLKFVHIAGTNGKGSTLAFCSEILKESGYRVGRYLSPTIFEYRERIQINGKSVSKKELCRLMELMKGLCEEIVSEGSPHPTAFEIETAMAFLYFQEQNCDVVVLETGLGGLLDATNIVRTTVLEVITSISLDHMGILGNNLCDIAENKAGIMKPGSRVVAQKGDEQVMEILKRKAKELAIPITVADPSEITGVKSGLEKQSFHYKGYRDLTISLVGRYQLENAALSVCAMEELTKAGFPIKEKAIYRGLFRACWPGRFQILAQRPAFVADGAHNRDAAIRLAQSVQFYFTNRRIIYIIGMLRDKEQNEVLRVTCPLAAQILVVPTPGERGMAAYDLACIAREYHDNVTAVDSVQEAVELAYLLADKNTVIVAFGSLSYLGNLINIVKAASEKESRKKMGRDSHGKQRQS